MNKKNTTIYSNATIHNAGWDDQTTILPNATAEDMELSWEAKGLLFYLLTRPQTWQFSVEELINLRNPKDRETERKIIFDSLDEIKNSGYLVTDPIAGTYTSPYKQMDKQRR